MDNFMSNPVNTSWNNIENMQQMYPDAYTRIYPHVQYLVNSIGDENLPNVTNADIERIAQEAMRRGNVINDPPAGHNPQTVSDMTRALVVRDFRDRHRRFRFFPFFFPFFPFIPFDFRDRDRDRDRDHDRDRDRDRY